MKKFQGVVWKVSAFVAMLAVACPGVGFAELGSVVFEVTTDKDVYTVNQVVRVQGVVTNPTDDSMAISVSLPYYKRMLVIDISNQATVYEQELTIPISQVITPHAKQVFALGTIPAGVLKPSKRYKILLNLSLNMQHLGPDQYVTDRVFPNPIAVITTV